MSLVSKIVGSVSPKAAGAFTKCTGKALSYTKDVCGVPVKTYLKTGTKVAKNVDGNGAKSIVLGAGNKLSKILGKGTNITSYPKGHFFGGDTGMILVSGNPKKLGMPFLPKEFGDFIKMLTEMAK